MLVRAGALALSLSAVCSAATLRVADWNLANHPNNAEDKDQLRTILNYAGSRIDLLMMAETDTGSAPDTATVFGSVYGGTYASVVAPADGGGDRTGFVYNTSTLSLVSTSTIGVGTLTHPTLRAQFRPSGTTGTDDFYAYAVHLQSGSSAQYKNIRVNEAAALRSDVDGLGSANVIIAGDFNWQKADDVSAGVGAYRTLAAAGEGQVVDPLNKVGDWHGNAAYAPLFTEDPDANMDDRFDMQLVSGELMNGVGLDYVPGSYRVVGNDGTIAPGGVLNASATLPADVATAMRAFSDHLPVLADYSYALGDPRSLYFAGTASNSLTLPGNYATTASGMTASTAMPGGDTDVYFASSNAIASNLNTSLSRSLSVRSLTFGTAGGNGVPITLGGTATLTITAGPGNYTAGTGITKEAGSAAVTIGVPVVLGSSQTWSNASSTPLIVSGSVSLNAQTLTVAGPGSTTISGNMTGNGGVVVLSSGTTRLSGVNTYAGTTTVNHVNADVRVSSTAATPLLDGGGADLVNGQIAFEYAGLSPAATIRSLLAAGYASGFSEGQFRSTAATSARGLGYRDDGSAVIVRATLYGDADLDGGVSINDFNALAANFGKGGKVWVDGDFDFDGGVSINDFNLLAAGFGQSVPSSNAMWAGLLAFAAAHNDLAAFESVTGVPEPAVLLPTAVVGTLALRRRSRIARRVRAGA